jgi:hypothetical protein
MQNDNAQQSLGQIADHLQLCYDIQSYTDFANDPVALLKTDPYIPASVISELEAETYTD